MAITYKMFKKAYDVPTANDMLSYARLQNMMEQRERNANRVLKQELGIDDPTTAQRRLGWRQFGKVLKRIGILGGLGAAAGAISAPSGSRLEAAGGLGAIGAGAGILAAALESGIGSIQGSLARTNPDAVRTVYQGDKPVSLGDMSYAKSQLGKMVQQRMSDYQAEAPTQVIV